MPTSKSKVFFIIATLLIILLGCFPKEGTFIQGDIIEINKENGDMEIEIESWTTVGSAGSSTESYEFEKKPNAHTIRVTNPKKYEEGQKVEVKVIKNYEEDVWDIDKLKFEVEKVN